MTVESTLASFAKGIETGVSTLELDLQITKDGHEVITHDRKISGQKCLERLLSRRTTHSSPTWANTSRT